ncbi:MAG: hypothetical protein NTX04_07750 [Verrucomicrobia bacterium]|nr:hypothetical protein [Verrucomicrobiota bacterium]
MRPGHLRCWQFQERGRDSERLGSLLNSVELNPRTSGMIDAQTDRSLLLVVEQRFTQALDGRVWTTGHYAYPFLSRLSACIRSIASSNGICSAPKRADF